MNPQQQSAPERAVGILCEHFGSAVVIVQPDAHSAEVAVGYVGSVLTVPSLCSAAQMRLSEDEPEQTVSDEDKDDGDDWKTSKA